MSASRCHMNLMNKTSCTAGCALDYTSCLSGGAEEHYLLKAVYVYVYKYTYTHKEETVQVFAVVCSSTTQIQVLFSVLWHFLFCPTLGMHKRKHLGSTRPSAGSYTWVTTTPCNTTGLEKSVWKAAWRKRTWGCWSTAG